MDLRLEHMNEGESEVSKGGPWPHWLSKVVNWDICGFKVCVLQITFVKLSQPEGQ